MLSRPPSRQRNQGRHQRERALTIAAGFVCCDGVVLAADSQFTGTNKRYGAKVFALGTGAKSLAVAGAGDRVLINGFVDDVRHRFDAVAPEHVLQMLQDALYPLWLKHIASDEDACLWLLVALRLSAAVTLYENDGGGRFAPVVAASQCIGNGKGLGLYICDRSFQAGMPMRVARNVAVEMLKQTKHYERDSCGGASQIWMVPTDCGVDLSDVSQVDIASLESQLERAGADTARLLALGPGITGVDFNQETAERRRQTLDTAVSAAQTQYETLNGMIALKGELGLLKITPQPPPDEDSEG